MDVEPEEGRLMVLALRKREDTMKNRIQAGLPVRSRSVILIATLSLPIVSSSASWAEFYCGGGNFPLDLRDVKIKSVNNQPIDI